jgi:hypothetical protein
MDDLTHQQSSDVSIELASEAVLLDEDECKQRSQAKISAVITKENDMKDDAEASCDANMSEEQQQQNSRPSLCKENEAHPSCYASPSPEGVTTSEKTSLTIPPKPQPRSRVISISIINEHPSTESLSTEFRSALVIPTLSRFPSPSNNNNDDDDVPMLSLSANLINPNEADAVEDTMIPRIRLQMRPSNQTVASHHDTTRARNIIRQNYTGRFVPIQQHENREEDNEEDL